MSTAERYDLVVVGSGPGGQNAAITGVRGGARVALIERERTFGGSCVYQGTIPSKTLREAAVTLARLRRGADAFEAGLRPGVEMSTLISRLERVLAGHARFIGDQLADSGIELVHARARLTGPRTIEALGRDGTRRTLAAETIVIATGSRPRAPAGIPIDHEHVVDSDSILSMTYLPRSLLVLGSGVIACEYASVFALLGVEVTLVDRAARPLGFLDPELTERFVRRFEASGGRFLGARQVAALAWDGVSQVRAEFDGGERVAADKALVALGRTANVEGLGLDVVGIELSERGHIEVDACYRTRVPGIFAVGDVIGPPALAASSMEQGRRAVCHALGLAPGQPFEVVPLGIYAVPEMASVGWTEAEVRERHGAAHVGRAPFEELARGQIAGIEDGLLKLVAGPDARRVLGVQIVGDGATDLIHLGQLAIVNGNDVAVFLENVMNFPTLAEAYRVAALNLLNAARAQGVTTATTTRAGGPEAVQAT